MLRAGYEDLSYEERDEFVDEAAATEPAADASVATAAAVLAAAQVSSASVSRASSRSPSPSPMSYFSDEPEDSQIRAALTVGGAMRRLARECTDAAVSSDAATTAAFTAAADVVAVGRYIAALQRDRTHVTRSASLPNPG